jgi:site-specific DNA-methyltransferase (adenine-specific)
VCGTFKERAGWHGCQMPEQLLGRIIRACSNEGELVLDPFAGSGTTLAVAKKLGRKFLGFELSQEYSQRIEERLAQVQPGDALDGAAEPLVSAPNTANGRRLDEVEPSNAQKIRRARDARKKQAGQKELL